MEVQIPSTSRESKLKYNTITPSKQTFNSNLTSDFVNIYKPYPITYLNISDLTSQ